MMSLLSQIALVSLPLLSPTASMCLEPTLSLGFDPAPAVFAPATAVATPVQPAVRKARKVKRAKRAVPSAVPMSTAQPAKATKAAAGKAKAAKVKSKARPKKASSVLAQVQKFYAQANDLQARFSQTYYKASLSVLAKSKGWLRVQKPHLMQWDYDGKGQDIFANGKEVWFVDHETRQVISSKVSAKDNVNVGLKFLFGDTSLLREYLVRYAKGNKAKRYGGPEHWVLQLKPRKKSPHFKGLVMSVHKDTGRVDRFVVYAHDNSSNYFELEDFRTNVGLDAAIFKKKIPAGYVQTRE